MNRPRPSSFRGGGPPSGCSARTETQKDRISGVRCNSFTSIDSRVTRERAGGGRGGAAGGAGGRGAHRGEAGGLEADGDAGDDVGAVAGGRRRGDPPDGLVRVVGVVLRELEEEERVAQPDHPAARELPPGVGVRGGVQQRVRRDRDADRREDEGDELANAVADGVLDSGTEAVGDVVCDATGDGVGQGEPQWRVP